MKLKFSDIDFLEEDGIGQILDSLLFEALDKDGTSDKHIDTFQEMIRILQLLSTSNRLRS